MDEFSLQMTPHHHRAYRDCACREKNRETFSPDHFFHEKILAEQYKKNYSLPPRRFSYMVMVASSAAMISSFAAITRRLAAMIRFLLDKAS